MEHSDDSNEILMEALSNPSILETNKGNAEHRLQSENENIGDQIVTLDAVEDQNIVEHLPDDDVANVITEDNEGSEAIKMFAAEDISEIKEGEQEANIQIPVHSDETSGGINVMNTSMTEESLNNLDNVPGEMEAEESDMVQNVNTTEAQETAAQPEDEAQERDTIMILTENTEVAEQDESILMSATTEENQMESIEDIKRKEQDEEERALLEQADEITEDVNLEPDPNDEMEDVAGHHDEAAGSSELMDKVVFDSSEDGKEEMDVPQLIQMITEDGKVIMAPFTSGTHIQLPDEITAQLTQIQNNSKDDAVDDDSIQLKDQPSSFDTLVNTAVKIGNDTIEIKQEKKEKDDEGWCDVGLVLNHPNCHVTSYYKPGPNFDPEHPNITSENLPTYDDNLKIELEPGTAYRFRVCAVNSAGRGPWSEVSAFKTCMPGYPGAPSSIKISKSPGGAHISWEPPFNSAGTILEYSVCLAVKTDVVKTDGKPNLTFVRVYSGPHNQTIVPQSSINSAHIDRSSKPAIIFRIAARNEKGFGPATQVRWLQDVPPTSTRREYYKIN